MLSPHLKPRQLRARTRADLAALADGGVQLVYWPRTLSHSLRTAAHAMAQRPDGRAVGVVRPDSMEDIRSVVAEYITGIPYAEHLLADVARLCATYGRVTGEARVRVQLARLEAQECTLFHVDQITHRLLVTYFGPGTEWLPEARVNRATLRAPDLSLSIEERNARVSRGPARSASAGTVLMMRGGRWPGNHGLGAVHRSPPSGPTSPRVKLTIDAAPDFAEHTHHKGAHR